jgi:hypothetical protein
VRDYSQAGDPYHIAEEYTAQSAAQDSPGPVWKKVGGDRDVRGNSLIAVRGLPTQAEADAVVAKARLERLG